MYALCVDKTHKKWYNKIENIVNVPTTPFQKRSQKEKRAIFAKKHRCYTSIDGEWHLVEKRVTVHEGDTCECQHEVSYYDRTAHANNNAVGKLNLCCALMGRRP